MIILTINNTNKNIETSFILLNETDLSITKIPFVKEFNSTFIDPFDNIEYTNNPHGVTHDKDNIYISNRRNIASFDIKTFEFKQIISKTGINMLSTIEYYNGHIYRCDSDVNCISKINVETLDETYIDVIQGTVIPELYKQSFTREKNVVGNNCSFFINNNNLHLWCGEYCNIVNDDHNSLLEHYKNTMNSTPDVSVNNNNLMYNKTQSNIWNMLIVKTTGVTRANSFDYYFDPTFELASLQTEKYNNYNRHAKVITRAQFRDERRGPLAGIVNGNVLTEADVITRPQYITAVGGNRMKRETLTERSNKFGSDVVFNAETNSVEHINKLYGTIKSGLIVINGITWTVCNDQCLLIKSQGNDITTYKLENEGKYILSCITYNNNNIYIFAFPKDMIQSRLSLTNTIQDKLTKSQFTNDEKKQLIDEADENSMLLIFNPETLETFPIFSNNEQPRSKEQYINRPYLQSLMFIFNINTEKVECKFLTDDIFSNSYVNNADFL